MVTTRIANRGHVIDEYVALAKPGRSTDMSLERKTKRLAQVLAVMALGWVVSGTPSHAAFLDDVVVKTVTRAIPSPRGFALSPGGAYGDYLYVISRGTDIYRINPDGEVEYFTTRRPGNGHASTIFFDETPDARYGGHMFVTLDCLAGPCLAGIDRVLPDGTMVPFINGLVTFPLLLGTFDGLIDNSGLFGNEMFFTDFEADDHSGSLSNVLRASPVGAVSLFDSVALRGALAMDIDRGGLFGGDLLVSNFLLAPWWQGENAVWRVAPNGSRTLLVPDQGQGFPWDVLVDATGNLGGHLLVLYASDTLIEFDATGAEVARITIPGAGAGGGALAQDRYGSFGGDLFYTAPTLNEVRRIVPAVPDQELCNGLDDDGDGSVDEDFDLGRPCTSGVGACATVGLTTCSPDGLSSCCDAIAGEPTEEVCDGIDNNCDGIIPAEESDQDGDGELSCAGDCDDTNPTISTTATEFLDGLDNDCDGLTDEGLDEDGDGVPDLLDVCAGTPPSAGVGPDGCAICSVDPDDDEDGFPASADCDDLDAAVNPDAPEVCNDTDDDCDGAIDEGFDTDGDGFLDADACGTLPGPVDCDDTNAAIHPDALELPGNAVDENCDGSLGNCDPVAGPEGLGWKNHGEYVRCVAHEVNGLVAAGDLTQDEGDELVQHAAQSDIGKK